MEESMTHPNKPFNRYDREDWEDYYSRPENFARLYADRQGLLDQKERMDLSTSQEERLEVIEELIAKQLAI